MFYVIENNIYIGEKCIIMFINNHESKLLVFNFLLPNIEEGFLE